MSATVAAITDPWTADAEKVLADALVRCRDRQWTSVFVIGYVDGDVEMRFSGHASTESVVGALERAKWELFEKAGKP